MLSKSLKVGMVALLLVSVSAQEIAHASGPSLQSVPIKECVTGIHESEQTVAEGNNGRFTRYNLTGSHRFDASNINFDGYDSNNEFVHWPVAIKVADGIDQKFGYETGTLIDSSRRETHHNYQVYIPDGLDVAHFYMQFDVADPNRKLYMKLTDPNGNGTFYNQRTASYESAVVTEPTEGLWTVRAAIKANTGTNVNYSLLVDDDETIELDKITGTLVEPARRQTHHNYTVNIPEGMPMAHFFMQLGIADPNKKLYMKLTNPQGEGTFYNSRYDNYESAIINKPMAGEWKVRAAIKAGTGADVTYKLTVGNDEKRPTTGCWYGGVINGAWDENADNVTWENPYHHSGGLTLEMDNFLVEDVSVISHGDGIRPYGDNITIDGAYVADIHDDCVENDNLGNLLITDSLFDGCYVGFSARLVSGSSYDGSDNLFEIRDSLVRLEAQPTVYKPEKYGEEPGHGQFFKWTSDPDKAIKLAVHNTIFLASQVNRHGGGLGVEEVSNLESCSNNVMVWTGTPGEFPNQQALEDTGCFTVVEDYNVWLAAEAAWRARHLGRPTHP